MASPALLALARRVNSAIAAEGRFMQLAEDHVAHVLELGGGLLPVHLEAVDAEHEAVTDAADAADKARADVQGKLDQALSREGDVKALLAASEKRVAVLTEAQNIAKQRIAELERASVDEKTEHSAEIAALTKRIDDLAAKVPAAQPAPSTAAPLAEQVQAQESAPVAADATPPIGTPAQ